MRNHVIIVLTTAAVVALTVGVYFNRQVQQEAWRADNALASAVMYTNSYLKESQSYINAAVGKEDSFQFNHENFILLGSHLSTTSHWVHIISMLDPAHYDEWAQIVSALSVAVNVVNHVEIDLLNETSLTEAGRMQLQEVENLIAATAATLPDTVTRGRTANVHLNRDALRNAARIARQFENEQRVLSTKL